MPKPFATALVLFAACSGWAEAASLAGKPVPLFPTLTWGLDREAALAKGLKTYQTKDTALKVVGLPSVTIGGIDFTAEARFGEKDVSAVRTGLNTILLRHEGFVSVSRYNAFLHAVTSGYLYAGRGSSATESSVFYNAIDRGSGLVVTSAADAPVSLRLSIAPGVTR